MRLKRFAGGFVAGSMLIVGFATLVHAQGQAPSARLQAMTDASAVSVPRTEAPQGLRLAEATIADPDRGTEAQLIDDDGDRDGGNEANEQNEADEANEAQENNTQR